MRVQTGFFIFFSFLSFFFFGQKTSFKVSPAYRSVMFRELMSGQYSPQYAVAEGVWPSAESQLSGQADPDSACSSVLSTALTPDKF